MTAVLPRRPDLPGTSPGQAVKDMPPSDSRPRNGGRDRQSETHIGTVLRWRRMRVTWRASGARAPCGRQPTSPGYGACYQIMPAARRNKTCQARRKLITAPRSSRPQVAGQAGISPGTPGRRRGYPGRSWWWGGPGPEPAPGRRGHARTAGSPRRPGRRPGRRRRGCSGRSGCRGGPGPGPARGRPGCARAAGSPQRPGPPPGRRRRDLSGVRGSGGPGPGPARLSNCYLTKL